MRETEHGRLGSASTLVESFARRFVIQVVGHVAGRVEQTRSPRTSFSAWDSTPFVTRVSERPETFDQAKKDFASDFESFIREFALLQSVIRYERYGVRGMQNSYSDTVSSICRRHGETLVASGKNPSRANLEADVFAQFESWVSSDVSPDSALIIISPRGSLDEGYPGLNSKHYNCVYVFLKNTDDTARFFQFRSWDSNQQLLELQNTLSLEGDRAIVPTPPTAPAEHKIFAQTISLPARPEQDRIGRLERELYRHQRSWIVNPAEVFPIIDGELLEKQMREAQAASAVFFDRIFQPLAAQMTESNLELDGRTQTDGAIQRDQLDLALLVCKETLQRWAHDHAQNYDPSTQREQYLVTAEKLLEIWESRWEVEQGTASSAQKALVKEQHLSTEIPLASPLNQAASMLHCGIGSLNPTSMIDMNQLSALNNPSMLAAQLQQLSSSERTHLLAELSNYVSITIHGETWFVPPSYLEQLGCTFDPVQNAVVGPCVDPNRAGTGRIPLRDDPDAYTATQYRQLVRGLRAIDSPELDGDSSALGTLSPAEQLLAATTYRLLSSILVRHVVGLEAGLLHNDYVLLPSELAAPYLHQLARTIESLEYGSPLMGLLAQIAHIVSSHRWEEIELIANEVVQINPAHVPEVITLGQQVFSVSGHSLHLDQFSQGQALPESMESAGWLVG